MPVTLAPPNIVPTPDNSEIGYLTDVQGDELTITRAQEGSSAKAVAAGWVVYGAATRKTFEDIEDAVDARLPKTGGSMTGRIDFPATSFDITNPPIRFTDQNVTNDESSKGNILEWGGMMTPGTNYPYGIATNAYAASPGSTFTVPGVNGVPTYKKWGWILTHYNSPASTGELVHQHLNLETVKADWQTVITRLQISFGEDTALVSFPNSNVKVFDSLNFQIGTDAAGAKIRHDTSLARILVNGSTAWRWAATAEYVSAAAGGVMLTGAVTGESVNRFSMNTSGRMEWGSGSLTRDVNLYRNAADQLKTDDKFVAGAGLDSGSQRGTNFADPTSAQDAATKAYVDNGDATTASTAQTNLMSHTSRTDNPHSVTKTQVGLAAVDNTSDLNKPVSTATQAALDTKAAKLSIPQFSIPVRDAAGSGEVNSSRSYSIAVSNSTIPVRDGTGAISTAAPTASAHAVTKDYADTQLALKEPTLTPGTVSQYLRGDKSWQTLDKSAVGLANIDNTSDANKPISTATQTALNNKVAKSELMVNVKDFGAVGNNSNDDTSAINAAIQSLASTGGIVYLPPGIYKITAHIVLLNGVSLIGAGADATTTKGTIIRQYTPSANGVYMEATTGNLGNLRISDLRIDTGVTNTGGRGLYLKVNDTGATPLYISMAFKNLFIKGFGVWGVEAQGIIVSSFENVTCHSNGGGFFLDGDPYNTGYSRVVTSVTMTACYANGNTGIGYKLNYVVYSVLSSCAADNNDQQYYFNLCDAITLQSCGAEWAASTTPTVGTAYRLLGCSRMAINNCSSYRATGGAIYMGVVGANTTGYVTVLGFWDGASRGGATLTVEANCQCLLINTPTPNGVSGTGTVSRHDAYGSTMMSAMFPVNSFARFENTADQTTNYERVRFLWSSNVFQMISEAGGTGTRRDLLIGYSTTLSRVYSGGATKILDQIGSTGATNKLINATGTLAAASGNQDFQALSPTVNQSGTASYAARVVDVTETSLGSGTKKLDDLRIGGVSKASVDNAGQYKAAAFIPAFVAKAAAYTLTTADSIVTGNATGGAFSLTLPTAVGIAGRSYTLKKIDASGNAVTVATTSSQTIDASTTYSLAAQYKYVTVVSDGANWLIVGNN
ncbi:glycosyl hydrolase family 28-related protein [Streptomyces sp. NPDC056401]|uniref:glycosyl hydrolase family 28-related protein n=1 Tax=Streptomyces sp. NPDC056401 TaxID=3345809 RepID=UPI0035DED5AD